MLTRLMCVVLAMALVQPVMAVGKKNVRYLGGSWADVKVEREGKVRFDEDAITLCFKEGDHSIPYERITIIEYGQHAGRRVAETVVLGALTLGVLALPMLLTKKRKHFASVGWKDDDGATQGVVLEFGKAVKRGALQTMSMRSGVEIEFEDERARAHFGQ